MTIPSKYGPDLLDDRSVTSPRVLHIFVEPFLHQFFKSKLLQPWGRPLPFLPCCRICLSAESPRPFPTTQLRQRQLCSPSPTMAGGSRLPNSLQAAVEAEAPGCLVAGREHPQNDDLGVQMNPTKFATFAMLLFCCFGTIMNDL